MPNITFQLADGRELHVDAPVGISLMKSAVSADVPGIIGECGGEMTCATCHVRIGQEWLKRLPERGDEETELLEMTDDFDSASRLSCQVEVSDDLDGLTVSVLTA